MAGRHYPTALMPPPRGDAARSRGRTVRAYAVYLVRLCRRLAGNPLVDAERKRRIEAEAVRLSAGIRQPREALVDMILEVEREAVEPAFATLDERALREVRASVRDVMIGVTLSPWRSVDLAVVIYRNAGMIMRIVRTYCTRPRAREQMLVLRDVLYVVATVNFLNYGTRLFHSLTAALPVLGRFADDVAQGIGAGLLTSIAGHAAVDRCRAFQGWDREQARETVRSRLREFLVDIKGIATQDVVPRLRRSVEALLPESERGPDTLVHLGDGVAGAIDETCEAMDTFFVRPAIATATGVNAGRPRGLAPIADLCGAGMSVVRNVTATSFRGLAGATRAVTKAAGAIGRAFSRMARPGSGPSRGESGE
jgi:hypothetical protein